MASVIVSDRSLQNIANAIRNKNGLTDTYTPSQMAAAINALTPNGGFAGTPTAGDTPVLINHNGFVPARSTEPSATGISLTIPIAGTYRIKFIAYNSYSNVTYFNYISAVRLYKNSVAVGEQQEITALMVISQDITCEAGDVIEIYASSANTSYRTAVAGLTACINWDNGFIPTI